MDPSKRRYLLALRHRSDLTAAERHELDMAAEVHGPNWWLSSSEMTWRTKVDRLAAFYRETGEWPRQKSDDASERTLAAFHDSLRNPQPGSKPLDAERLAFLHQTLPEWQQDNHDVAWFRRADELVAFHGRHGRFPSLSFGDRDERILATWMVKSRSYAGRGQLSDERLGYLDTRLPGWRDRERNSFVVRADELAAFRREHRRWPSRGSASPAEARLAMWLSRAISHEATGKPSWSPDRGAYLDEVTPGWRQRA